MYGNNFFEQVIHQGCKVVQSRKFGVLMMVVNGLKFAWEVAFRIKFWEKVMTQKWNLKEERYVHDDAFIMVILSIGEEMIT